MSIIFLDDLFQITDQLDNIEVNMIFVYLNLVSVIICGFILYFYRRFPQMRKPPSI